MKTDFIVDQKLNLSASTLTLPYGSLVKNPSANGRDADSIPGLGGSPGGGNGNPLKYSCLGNPMDRRAWWATVHRVSKSQTRLSTQHSLYSYMCLLLDMAVVNGYIILELFPPLWF